MITGVTLFYPERPLHHGKHKLSVHVLVHVVLHLTLHDHYRDNETLNPKPNLTRLGEFASAGKPKPHMRGCLGDRDSGLRV